MELGAFYSQIKAAVYEKGLDIDNAMDTARAHGITQVDVSAQVFDEMSPAAFKKHILAHDMKIVSVHGIPVCDVSNKIAQKESIAEMKRQMEKALAAESKFFMIVPQMAATYCPQKHTEYVSSMRELFAEVSEYGKEIGIQATVENFSRRDYPYTSFDDIDWLLTHIPELMYTYDSGNFPLAGFDELEGLKLFLPRTVYAHLKDLAVVEKSSLLRDGVYYDGPALGDGFVKNDEAVDYLIANGYDGVFTIEICCGDNLYEKLLKSADRYMKKLK